MAIKATFTFDEATIALLRQTAERLGKPKSQVMREAIRDYHQRIGRLGERERIRLLRVFDEMIGRIPSRPQAEADKELRSIRLARRAGGRRSARRKAR